MGKQDWDVEACEFRWSKITGDRCPPRFLRWKCKSRESCLRIDKAELNVENGLNLLLEKLDKVFQEETIDEA